MFRMADICDIIKHPERKGQDGMDQEQYGAYLRSLRISQGKGKEEVARGMGIPVELLESWEDGLRLPDEGQLQLLSAVLQVTFQQICPPDAPKKRKGLSHGQIALIIAGAMFALGMTILNFRSYEDYLSSARDQAASIREETHASLLESDGGQAALDYIAESPAFSALGLKTDDLSLINYETGYRYAAQGLVLCGEYIFQAGDYQFHVTCIRIDGEWQVAGGNGVFPL